MLVSKTLLGKVIPSYYWSIGVCAEALLEHCLEHIWAMLTNIFLNDTQLQFVSQM